MDVRGTKGARRRYTFKHSIRRAVVTLPILFFVSKKSSKLLPKLSDATPTLLCLNERSKNVSMTLLLSSLTSYALLAILFHLLQPYLTTDKRRCICSALTCSHHCFFLATPAASATASFRTCLSNAVCHTDVQLQVTWNDYDDDDDDQSRDFAMTTTSDTHTLSIIVRQ